MNNTQHLLKRVIQWGAALILFVPLLVNGRFLFPYIHLKNASFRLLMSVLIVAAVWLVLERGYIRGKKNLLLYALGIFFVVMTLATIFGYQPYWSFWSNYERMEGWITITMLVVYVWLLIQVFETKREWVWLLRTSLLAAVGVSFYGLLQIWGVQNSWILPASSIRISSTIGNPAFFASYLMFNLFFAGLLYYLDKVKWWRVVYALVAFFYIIMIYNTGTRGPIVGLAASAFVMGILYWFKAGKKARLIIASGLVLIILFGSFLYVERQSDWIKKYHAFDRIANISLTDSTTKDRLLTWRTSFKSFMDRPVLGWGPDNYRYGFNKYYNPNLEEQWFDRAHSVIFDYLNAGGALGLASYLLVLLTAVYYLWRYRQQDYGLSVIVLGLLTAYFFQNLFVFDTLNTYLPLFLTLALVAYLANQDKEEDEINWQVKGSWQALKMIILGVLILAVIIWDYQAIIKPAQANITAIEAYKNTIVNPAKALEYFNQALSYNTYGSREITLQLVSFSLNVLQNSNVALDMKHEIFAAADKAARQVLEVDPADIQMRLLLANLYQRYVTFDGSFIDKSRQLLEPHLSDSPDRLELYYSLAQSYLLKNDGVAAVRYLEKAFTITQEKAGTYINLLNVYSQLTDTGAFVKLAEEYAAKFALNPDQHRQLAQFYFNAGLYDKAKEIMLTQVIPGQIDNLQNYSALASIFKAQGLYNEAIAVMRKSLEVDSSWADEVAGIIEHLETERDKASGGEETE